MWIAMPVGMRSVLARRERERRVDACAQVEAGRSRRRIGGQVRPDALVENLQRDDRRHGHAVSDAASRARDLRDQPPRERELVHARQRMRAARRRAA